MIDTEKQSFTLNQRFHPYIFHIFSLIFPSLCPLTNPIHKYICGNLLHAVVKTMEVNMQGKPYTMPRRGQRPIHEGKQVGRGDTHKVCNIMPPLLPHIHMPTNCLSPYYPHAPHVDHTMQKAPRPAAVQG